MMKRYRITFDTKKHGDFTYAFDVTTRSAKAAREIAERLWYSSKSDHMFHIQVRLLAYDEEFLYHWFTLVTVKPMYRVVCRSRQNKPWVFYSGKKKTQEEAQAIADSQNNAEYKDLSIDGDIIVYKVLKVYEEVAK